MLRLMCHFSEGDTVILQDCFDLDGRKPEGSSFSNFANRVVDADACIQVGVCDISIWDDTRQQRPKSDMRAHEGEIVLLRIKNTSNAA